MPEESKNLVPANVDWLETTLAAVLVAALPGLPPEGHEVFAKSAAQAVAKGYGAMMALLKPAEPQD